MESYDLRFVKNLKEYLVSKKWSYYTNYGDYSEIWKKNNDSKAPNILIPTSDQPHNFSGYVRDALSVLADDLSISIIDLESAISFYDIERLSFRVFGNQVHDGRIGLSDGVSLNEKVKDFILSLARATISPSKFYVGGAYTKELDTLLSAAKLGQTQIGSYIVNIEIPKAIDVKTDQNSFEELPEAYFSERFADVLMKSLTTLNRVLREGQGFSHKSLEDIYRSGVSANLCDSICGMTGKSNDLDIEIIMARSGAQERPFSAIFKGQDVKIIQQISQVLKGTYTLKSETIVGEVEALDHKTDGESPYIKLAIMKEGTKRIVRVDVDETQYWKAVGALSNRNYIECIGDLVVKPKSSVMRNISLFRVIDYQEKLDL